MFSHMEGTLIVAGLIAAGVIVAAFAAEGRGQRVIRILLGVEERRPVREHLFDELDRPEASLDVVDKLGRPQTRELQVSGR
ncbi:hypothetical protein QQX10_04365 [Demequina sp. SYSU T00039]|uniref:Uncharacterized protein n=2 Tax=Demequina lignilytica TaxID=3051663 RepID=A0AAW7M7Z2_9MICO|nr:MULTISPECIES: hypothetical protein [unclassified Demequina]MDN4477227.1 hypothetical protein [Demequina sp. SYSU T00039-1]MDN4487400.1 hypothetical protein [Demequina sp. SYSU T00039]